MLICIHPSFSKFQTAFIIIQIACKTLSDIVGYAIALNIQPFTYARRDVLAKRVKISPGDYIPVCVGQYSRTSQVVICPIADLWCLRCLIAIFRYQLPNRIIHEYCFLRCTDFLYSTPVATKIVASDWLILRVLDFDLFVFSIIKEVSTFGILGGVARIVKRMPDNWVIRD
jgi:hypothetical protein